MPDGDFLITDSASSPLQSPDLAQALEKASANLTDVPALLGTDRAHRTLHANVNELLLSLGVKDLTQEGHHDANDPK